MELPLLRRLVAELDDRLRGARIDQVYALPRHHLAIVLGLRGAPRLWFSAEPDEPHLYLRCGSHPTPARPPAFAMAVRKHARGRRLESVGLLGRDRIVELRWDGSGARLILELVPRRATALLVDSQDLVVAVWNPRRGRPEVGARYSAPPRRARCEARALAAAEWRQIVSGASERERMRRLQTTVEGVTRSLARECLARRRAGEDLRSAVIAELERAATAAPSAIIYAPAPLDQMRAAPPDGTALLSPYPMPESMGSPMAVFDSLIEGAAAFYPERARLRLLDRSRSRIGTALRGRRARLSRARDRVVPRPDAEGAIDRLRRHADLLLAHPEAAIRDGIAEVPDDYSDGDPVKFAVRPELDRVANAQRMYRSAQRMQRKADFDRRRRAGLEHQLRQLDELAGRLQKMDSIAECRRLLQQIESLGVAVRAEQLRDPEALQPGTGDPAQTAGQAPVSTAPAATASYGSGIRVVTLAGGAEILIGRSATANDRLTHRVAAARDWWLHAEGPGSHVVLRNPRRAAEPTPDALVAAASLAAWFSRSRAAAKVEVHWTRVADLRRPRKGAPGQVLMIRHRSLRVRPQPPEAVTQCQEPAD